jgi:hypothetical protein
MAKENLTEAEILFCKWQYAIIGDFYKTLISAMMRADIHNQAKLAKGFPDLMEVVIRYKTEHDYWYHLQKEWRAL